MSLRRIVRELKRNVNRIRGATAAITVADLVGSTNERRFSTWWRLNGTYEHFKRAHGCIMLGCRKKSSLVFLTERVMGLCGDSSGDKPRVALLPSL